MIIGELKFECDPNECPFMTKDHDGSGRPVYECPHDYDTDLLKVEFDGDRIICNGPKSVSEIKARAELAELREDRKRLESRPEGLSRIDRCGIPGRLDIYTGNEDVGYLYAYTSDVSEVTK